MHTPITEKQIMQLKKGDALLIHGTFQRIFSDGDIGIEVKETNIHTDEPQNNLIYVSPTCVSLPSEPPTSVGSHPQYDPCREFQPGDKVRMIMRDGRYPYCMRMREHIVPSDTILTVAANLRNGLVAVRSDGNLNEQVVGFYFLELVTPVEELEPYVICENDASYEVRLHSQKENHTMAIYNKNAYGNWLKARYAAETECARLNAEHRKEQSND